jgi:hypothetical protein
VVVPLEEEDLLFDDWVPNVDVVIKTTTQNQFEVCVPLQVVDSLLVVSVSGLELEVSHAPQDHICVQRSRGNQTHLRNREEVCNEVRVLRLLVYLFFLILQDGGVLEGGDVVAMDSVPVITPC